MASDIDQDEHWVWTAMEPEMTDKERELRDLFVTEFLVDYKPVEAAQRCGFQFAFAKDYAVKFMNESYVQKQIKIREHMKVDEKKMEEYDAQTVRAVLRKEMQNPLATAAARVQAATRMSVILGMDKPVETKNTHVHKGGVLMVPAIANINDWEALAEASQAKLVSDARH